MGNFSIFKNYSDFSTFSEIAKNAEELYPKYLKESIINCRRALEASIKWMFSVDKNLSTWKDPNTITLVDLMRIYDFKNLIGKELFAKIDYIRKKGNEVIHDGNTYITKGQCQQCIENLYYFLDFVAKIYQNDYTQKAFNASYLESPQEENIVVSVEIDKEVPYNELLDFYKSHRDEFTKRREHNQELYNPPRELSEYETRKIYIDEMVKEAGFIINRDWREEVPIENMPNKSNIGFADYVLYDDCDIPLAVIEAKKTCKNQSEGRKQAKLYADYFESKYKRRPIIFLTNGYETSIIDNYYQEREVSSIYSKKDLEKIFKINRNQIINIRIDDKISDRYYQKAAIKSVIETFNTYKRKALLVMATGSGKTRTVASLLDVLMKNNWVERALFLTDRTALITQAKRAFTNYLPDLSLTSLNDSEFDSSARCVFSTYQTMINKIDNLKENSLRVFTPGYFDIIIIDEAHRSIYKKYKDIFMYFDCLVVGLTATPVDQINRNTYLEFELNDKEPTFAYTLDQAVNDKFLVPYLVNKTSTKFLNEGIEYNKLSDEEKEEYEQTFTTEDELESGVIENVQLNEYIFNDDTIKKVLSTLMTKGIRVDFGNRIGKTIIFAQNHNHADAILKVFNREYSDLKEYAEVIDNKINYAQSLIDDFSVEKKKPHIAISVDMLDTGIDVPEIVNLVFFKKVYSKSKFYQMIGRGTRTCEGLLDGNDKKNFLIFDPCGNFEFFSINEKEVDSSIQVSLQSNLFNVEIELIHKTQDLISDSTEYKEFRNKLISEVCEKIQLLDLKSFRVKEHLRYVNKYSIEQSFIYLQNQDVIDLKNEISPLIMPTEEDYSAIHFDYLMHFIELAYLCGKKAGKQKKLVKKLVKNILMTSNIPEIQAKQELMNKIITSEYLDNCDINLFENIRIELRNLMKFVKRNEHKTIMVNFQDELIELESEDINMPDDSIEDYKLKFESYIKEHLEDRAISKIRNNEILDDYDMVELDKIVNETLGSKEIYNKEYGNENLVTFIRGLVGLDVAMANKLFSKFLDEKKYNSKQIYFVKQIIDYIGINGLIRNIEVLKSAPFNNYGSIIDLFSNNYDDFEGIKNIIDDINKKGGLVAA